MINKWQILERERKIMVVGGAKKDKVNYAYVGEIFVNYCFLFKLKYFTGNTYIGKLVDVYYFDKPLPKILLKSPFCACMLSHSAMSNSLRPHGLQPARSLCPLKFSRQDSGVGCHFLFQGIFPTQGSKPASLVSPASWVDSLPLCHQGSSVPPPHFSKQTRCTGDNFLTSMWTLSSDHDRLQPETTTELETLCKWIVPRQCTTERTRCNPSEKTNAWGKLCMHPYFVLFPKWSGGKYSPKSKAWSFWLKETEINVWVCCGNWNLLERYQREDVQKRNNRNLHRIPQTLDQTQLCTGQNFTRTRTEQLLGDSELNNNSGHNMVLGKTGVSIIHSGENLLNILGI